MLLQAYNWQVFGRASFDNGLVEFYGRDLGYLASLPANVAGSLVDPQRGVLVLYPALLVVLPQAVREWRTRPAWVRSAAVAGLAALATQLALNRYSGGDSLFGSRLTIEALTLAFPLLVLGRGRMGRGLRRFTTVLLYVSIFFHAIGAVVYPHVGSGAVSLLGAVLIGAGALAAADLVRRRAGARVDDTVPRHATVPRRASRRRAPAPEAD